MEVVVIGKGKSKKCKPSKRVSQAGATLRDKKSSKKAKKEAAIILVQHKDNNH